jgi:acetoin utilization deacetylase AcuC-like enzyme
VASYDHPSHDDTKVCYESLDAARAAAGAALQGLELLVSGAQVVFCIVRSPCKTA